MKHYIRLTGLALVFVIGYFVGDALPLYAAIILGLAVSFIIISRALILDARDSRKIQA
jgi:hypothetical protein